MSATNKQFNFAFAARSGQFEQLNLLRFAQLDPHIIVAQDSRNSTEPFHLNISVKVSWPGRPQLPPADPKQEVLTESQDFVAITLGIVLGVFVFVALLVIVVILVKKKEKGGHGTSSRSKIKCCVRLKKKTTRNLQFQSKAKSERQALQDEIEKSAMEQSIREKKMYQIEH